MSRSKRLRLGMVGGGQGGFIGAVHRIAARIDDRFELVAGALSSDPTRAATSAADLGIAPDRAYASFHDMAQSEAAREDGIDAVAIVTPNHLHAAPSIAFLHAGIAVICDKPLAATPEQTAAMQAAAKASGTRFFLTHNYTGYPLMRHARAMVARGDLGHIRLVQVEYAQDWLAETIEQSGQKQASWAHRSQAIGRRGNWRHRHPCVPTGLFRRRLTPQALSAELHSFGPGRSVDDNAHILLRFAEGARGMLWASQVAVGCENGLRLRLFGETGGLEWAQETPNQMSFTPLGAPKQILTRGGAGTGAAWTRIPPGHPEGYLEGFATLYNDIADVIATDQDNPLLPGLDDGLAGMWFISAAQTSSASEGAWIPRHG